MLELMVTGSGSAYYPDSGPGPKRLSAGDESLGYFGRVPQSELITASSLFQLMTPVTGKLTANDSMVWLKFFYNGKVVYYPSQDFLTGINWLALYEKGVTYGDRNELYGYVGSPAVRQYRTITVEDMDTGARSDLVVRLTKLNDSGLADTVADPASEMFALMPKVTPLGTYGTGEWDALPANVLRINGMWYTATDNINNPTQTLAINGSSTVMAISRSATFSSAWWYPVLELVSSDIVQEIDNITVALAGMSGAEIHRNRGSDVGLIGVGDFSIGFTTDEHPTMSAQFSDTTLAVSHAVTSTPGPEQTTLTVESSSVTYQATDLKIATPIIPVRAITSTLH